MLIPLEENLYELRSESGKLLMQVERTQSGYKLLIKPHGATETSEVPLEDLLENLESGIDA